MTAARLPAKVFNRGYGLADARLDILGSFLYTQAFSGCVITAAHVSCPLSPGLNHTSSYGEWSDHAREYSEATALRRESSLRCHVHLPIATSGGDVGLPGVRLDSAG